MRNILLLIVVLLQCNAFSQTKKVLLEEFTGAHCGICPNGAYYTDSMLDMHPDLIAVAIHTYPGGDAMVFPAIDTIGTTFAQGAPLGAIDRICSTPPSTNTGVYINQWDNAITQRELVSPSLTVSVTPAWNSSTRNITANISVNILANLPAGDYRISLYVVEDSVTGTGSGFDQSNSFDQMPGSHWYGLGDPIVGYVHRHVARALLPGAWGRTGVLPSSPLNGQSFTTTFNYTLPAGCDENRVTLIAFVNEVSSAHDADQVLNAEQVDLIGPTWMNEMFPASPLLVYPSSSEGLFNVEFAHVDANYYVYDVMGRAVQSGKLRDGNVTVIDLTTETGGYYSIVIISEEGTFVEKVAKM